MAFLAEWVTREGLQWSCQWLDMQLLIVEAESLAREGHKCGAPEGI
ncbi:hypothetical protein OU5_1362 [Pseudomonas mandelii JR-1]|uniref:Uncharacterized protein n=1 Tax=Pseudomonas mandelii JR-1 TaxID=1147786 RepID=A0A024E737_9PSED|nr:hypothetical protein OU5_1362 [Pseudomonas mandelii JR-1]